MENIMSLVGRESVFRTATENGLIPTTEKPRTNTANLALRLARDGDWVCIVAIKGGKGLQERLAGVGLRVGVKVQILNNPMNGKVIIGHNGSRLFLGGGMAHKIQVAVIQGENQ